MVHCLASAVFLGLLVLIAVYGVAGFYVVDTDEQAVVRRFGAIAARVEDVLPAHLPADGSGRLAGVLP